MRGNLTGVSLTTFSLNKNTLGHTKQCKGGHKPALLTPKHDGNPYKHTPTPLQTTSNGKHGTNPSNTPTHNTTKTPPQQPQKTTPTPPKSEEPLKLA